MTDGFFYIFKSYSKAKNKFLKSYYSKQKLKHTIYLGANDLYDYKMSKFFPTIGFKWINPKEFDLNKYTGNSLKGCVLKVDLECPKELCELHNGYPFAPYKIEIKREMLSNYQIKLQYSYY